MTKKIYYGSVKKTLATLQKAPDRSQNHEMRDKRIEKRPCFFRYFRNIFITHVMFDKAIWDPSTLEYVFDVCRNKKRYNETTKRRT